MIVHARLKHNVERGWNPTGAKGHEAAIAKTPRKAEVSISERCVMGDWIPFVAFVGLCLKLWQLKVLHLERGLFRLEFGTVASEVRRRPISQRSSLPTIDDRSDGR